MDKENIDFRHVTPRFINYAINRTKQVLNSKHLQARVQRWIINPDAIKTFEAIAGSLRRRDGRTPK